LLFCGQSSLRGAGKFEAAQSSKAELKSQGNAPVAEEGSADEQRETHVIKEPRGGQETLSPSAVPGAHQQPVAIFVPELIPAEDFEIYRCEVSCKCCFTFP
jgi:hypothetical protein